ncbi:hypothetical protein GCM10023201_40970 [Actinomycetospora corticicola]
MLDLSAGIVEDLTVVREVLDTDGDPTGQAVHVLEGCAVADRLPSSDEVNGRERTTRVADVRCPDRDADVRASDRFRRVGDPAGRAVWVVEGQPARSPFPGGGCVFVIALTTG